jgi:hypothetical protein
VVDIYLNGTISDLATRRDEFASIIAAGGADGLIKRLHERTETLLGRTGRLLILKKGAVVIVKETIPAVANSARNPIYKLEN